MSCTCGSDEKFKKKLQTLQKKYDELRKNHRKLVGVTVELTEALEDYVKGTGRPDVNDTLSKCIKIYPNLFEKNLNQLAQQPENASKTNPEEKKMEASNDVKEQENVERSKTEEEKLPESEKEYYEGFWSKPRIPRTPQ